MSNLTAPISEEFSNRNPGTTVTSESSTGLTGGQTSIPRGHGFDTLGRSLGKRMLAGGILDEGKPQAQFGSTEGVSRATVKRETQSKATLITKSPHRKRVSGLGSTAGNTGNSGTVNKKELGGE